MIPQRVRPRYFGWRNRILQIAVLSGILTGGFILRGAGWAREWMPAHGWSEALGSSMPVRAFAVLFGIACIARCFSTYYLARQQEPDPQPISQRIVPLRTLASRMIHGPDGRLILFLMSMSIAAHIAQPFFNPFMLKKLAMDQAPDMYSLMLAAPLLGRALALRHCGSYAQRRGARALLIVGGVGLIPFSVNWLISDNFTFLFTTQLVSGAAWAAYELGTFLMLLETTEPEERTSMVSQYQFVNSCAQVVGNGLGAIGLWHWGSSWNAYAIIFVASLAARALTIPLLLRTRAGARHAPHLEMDTLAVRPSGSTVDSPVVASLDDRPTAH